jgi:hypothetical protein
MREKSLKEICEEVAELKKLLEESKQKEVTMRFILPEHEYDLECAHNGHKYRSILNEILQVLRAEQKYKDSSSINIERLRKMIADELREYGVDV